MIWKIGKCASDLSRVRVFPAKLRKIRGSRSRMCII